MAILHIKTTATGVIKGITEYCIMTEQNKLFETACFFIVPERYCDCDNKYGHEIKMEKRKVVYDGEKEDVDHD